MQKQALKNIVTSNYQMRLEADMPDGQTIVFNAFQVNDDEDIWEVTFFKKGVSHSALYELTHDHQPHRVLSFVMDALHLLVEQNGPCVMIFKAETDRVSVYSKMIARYVGDEYEVRTFQGKVGSKFVILRK